MNRNNWTDRAINVLETNDLNDSLFPVRDATEMLTKYSNIGVKHPLHMNFKTLLMQNDQYHKILYAIEYNNCHCLKQNGILEDIPYTSG